MNSLLNYYWIPLIIIYAIFYAWICKNNNEIGGKWFIFALIAGCWPLWAIVSKYTKNLLFDGFLYDFLLLVFYVGALAFLGAGESFKIIHWIGLSMCILGLILMKF